jgi:hypothetical protein
MAFCSGRGGVEVRHGGAVCVPNNPTTDFGMPQIVGGIDRVDCLTAEPDTKAPSPTYPALLVLPDQGPFFYISPPTVDYVTDFNAVFSQALGVYLSNSCYAVFNNTVVAYVLGHDRWDTTGHIV